MPASQFEVMKKILAAPSPVGLEGAMTYGVLEPYFREFMLEGWGIHQFKGNAAIVLDTAPGDTDKLSVMVVGHADKIRLQVRSIAEDGKIWVTSDSFIPMTLLGHEVKVFSEDPENPGNYRVIEGGTLEAIGAIHFAPPPLRSGQQGIKDTQLYLELQLHGPKKKQQVEELGVRAGDSILLNRPIRRGFSPDTFYGAYLDNGLGCFVTAEVARLVAEAGGLKNVRLLAAIATHEEIGRMGSRVLAGELLPDVLIGVDVSHDLKAAPVAKEQKFEPTTMGEGMTLAIGSIANAYLNALYQKVARELGIPVQVKLVGRDTGTDAMASVFAGRDAAATSIGFPIRNMHTISESGHTGDVLCAIHATVGLLQHLDGMNGGKGASRDDFKNGHARLDAAAPLKPKRP